MDYFTYSITAFITFIGIFMGLMLAKASPDEAHAFKKYIPSLQLLCLILSQVLLFIYFPFIIAGLIFILSFTFMFLFWRKRDINLLDYIVFSGVFIISSLNYSAHFYMTAIIFAFGILAGILFYVLHDKPKQHKVTYGYHKHSGKQLEFNEMSILAFKRYLFFFLLCIFNLVLANFLSNFI